jgi:hypothetical protein
VAAQEEVLQTAQSKAEDYYQQVMRLSADNEQLKAERAYLQNKAANEQPRMDAGDQKVIVQLSEENSDLKAQLAATWAKINDQTKKIEEERSAFWEELEAVRLKSEPPNRAVGAPGNVTLMTGAATTMPSKPASPLTSSFPQQRSGVQRQQQQQQQQQQPAVGAGASRGEVKFPATRSSPSQGAGAGPRAVPTRAGGPTEPMSRGANAMSPTITNSRPGLSYGNVPLVSGARDAYSQPVSTGQTAPRR